MDSHASSTVNSMACAKFISESQVPLSMGILQARILEWVAIPFSRGSSQPRDRTHISYVSCTGRRVLYQEGHLTYLLLKISADSTVFCDGNSKEMGVRNSGFFYLCIHGKVRPHLWTTMSQL